MSDYLPGAGVFKYRCDAGHLTQSLQPLKELTCWHCPNGEPCHGELYQESPKDTP